MRNSEQYPTVKHKKRRMLDCWVDNAAHYGSIDYLYTQRNNEKFFEKIPLKLVLIKPEKLIFDFTILKLINSYI
jgi:hypothetical protein